MCNTKLRSRLPKKAFSIAKKHMFAIENVQFTFYIVILAIRNDILWQSTTLFAQQTNCLRLPLIQCVINSKRNTVMTFVSRLYVM